MKSSYRRIAMMILDRYREYPDTQFWTDHNDNSGWCVRSSFDSERVADVQGVAFHAEDEAEADAVVEAIARQRSLHV